MADLDRTPILEEDVHAAMRNLAPYKSPGLDGIPAELYRALAGVLDPILTRLFNAFLSTNSFPTGFHQGLIVLLHKSGDPLDPANYRPITLLNTDYRIFAKILASRLSHHLSAIVEPEQTAFLRGRLIGENVHLLQLLPHLLSHHHRWAIVAFCDFHKAYDTVDRAFLL